MELGKYVRVLRLQRQWSQEELADAAHMRQNHVSAIELGARKEISAETAAKLAAAFGISLGDFQARRVPVIEGWPGKEAGEQTSNLESALIELAASNPRLARLVRTALSLPEDWRDDVFDALEVQLALIASLPKER